MRVCNVYMCVHMTHMCVYRRVCVYVCIYMHMYAIVWVRAHYCE